MDEIDREFNAAKGHFNVEMGDLLHHIEMLTDKTDIIINRLHELNTFARKLRGKKFNMLENYDHLKNRIRCIKAKRGG